MFEWLFKYSSSVWRDASFAFDGLWPLWVLPVAIIIALLLLLASLRKQPLTTGRKAGLIALQGFMAALVLTMIWQPVLRVQVAEKGENTVAWLVDTSQSMLTEDVPVSRTSTVEQQTRLASAQNVLTDVALDNGAEFEAALYSQGQTLDAIESVEELSGISASPITNIAGALDNLLGTVSDNALAAVVLLSDGSDNSQTLDAQWWQRLVAAGVPVHTVGLGRLRNPSDIQLSDVIIPELVTPNVQLTAQLRINHAAASDASVRVLAGSDLIAVQDIRLPADVTQSTHEIRLPSGDEGIRRLSFEVVADSAVSDPLPANNRQQRVVRVADVQQRILYVEGEPRWEYKFLRRALSESPDVEIVSLLRTSPNKFYRQGVRDAGELADGFPASRDTLFAYDAVIIGSLEAAELSTAQQLALRDFVSIRGGSLLMLGGRHGLADGGWGRSVVAAALPVILDARLSAETFARERYRAMPTVSGYRTPWLALDDTFEANQSAWEGLPPLADAQMLGTVKPGAVVLLERFAADASGTAAAAPLLVTQRYGKGQSLVLGTSGTWRWQMGLDSTDQRHEMFWKQLATTLVDGVLPRISVSATQAVYRDTDTAEVSVVVYDADYQPLQQAVLPIQVSLPDGTARTVELQADAQISGKFSGALDMQLDGPYTIDAMTPLGGESPASDLAAAEHWWVRESGTAESFDNNLQQEFLQRLADATGGSYLAYNDYDSLFDVLEQNNVALKREMSLPLWNMPVLFILLFLAKTFEWLLRLRWKRL